MDHVGSLLSRVLKKRGLTSHCEASLVIHHAENWISEHLQLFQADLRPTTFTNGVLTILCTHSIASQECQQKAQDLLTYLRTMTETEMVTDIRLSREGQSDVQSAN
ncbi:hypothetical protein COU78_02255 [Candidatus Peregrinibacteria bacterium CG10_big_fil_rev_8_21_14_0_10_49_24]|nr:MAG: hypothetical protein COV83_02235 [Candidatus Peregrinibacteria bacterium CG11_big_fil_rev_8_21_14_0_20_49_14]PIR50960.1 MAG: hypothetical protein COU78_02255 [Candidatus Peregrinibacteria bacterium CG10_big_fil_rev_8_21_14_0_10_49_24]PJA67513.1 MAG: hypothetical protein CO157_03735 [Candidatus Peregrinibacteria bacterium CG_4_9_14_3_um_filter_49_12]